MQRRMMLQITNCCGDFIASMQNVTQEYIDALKAELGDNLRDSWYNEDYGFYSMTIWPVYSWFEDKVQGIEVN